MMKVSQDPKYLTLARRFAQQIRSGQLQPGDRLPSFTQLRAQFGATPATVERLYAQLERENLIERRHRSGVFVVDKKSRRTLQGTIGFVMMGFAGSQLHPYNFHLQQGIQQAARAANVQILLLDQNDIKANLQKMDGLLLYEHTLSPFVQYPASGMPCVSLLKGIDAIASVIADDFAGGKSATAHLLSLGHQRIAALMSSVPEDGHDSLGEERLAGYRAALGEAGITPRPDWVRPVLYNPLENYAERGYQQMRQWLSEDWAGLNCTAILAQNDDVAIGIIKALLEEGLEVPGDISVVGFDGAGVDAHFSPRLTTVEVPLETIGSLGTQVLLQRINGEQTEVHTVLPVSLRTGLSTAAAKTFSSTGNIRR